MFDCVFVGFEFMYLFSTYMFYVCETPSATRGICYQNYETIEKENESKV